jgi:hypothetical protein
MHSDYLLFIDESGDHGLKKIDRHYPVFVLCGVLVHKDAYLALARHLSEIKLEIWGHDEIVLHEHDIRKPSGQFSVLQIQAIRNRFHGLLDELFARGEFQLISSIIRKEAYLARYPQPPNPYDLSMSFVLERAFLEVNARGQGARQLVAVVESRGPNEDAQLRAAFNRIVLGNNACRRALPFQLEMVSKKANSCGLQIADLAARPLGLRYLRPDQPNRAFQSLQPKIRRNATGRAEGYGVKLFP